MTDHNPYDVFETINKAPDWRSLLGKKLHGATMPDLAHLLGWIKCEFQCDHASVHMDVENQTITLIPMKSPNESLEEGVWNRNHEKLTQNNLLEHMRNFLLLAYDLKVARTKPSMDVFKSQNSTNTGSNDDGSTRRRSKSQRRRDRRRDRRRQPRSA